MYTYLTVTQGSCMQVVDSRLSDDISDTITLVYNTANPHHDMLRYRAASLH